METQTQQEIKAIIAYALYRYEMHLKGIEPLCCKSQEFVASELQAIKLAQEAN